ncbi:hypothetical protein FOB25_02210 [Citrobacter portucalensis]|uniref:hypothetical protein n=1 Tax=Citrobacter portucalensis TaxID=1639133 RepID=UPI001238A497|nr:hypothetical protein FOB25_02210 [Citrobacter portucalensis]
MRSIWLLPDRKQTGCVIALENGVNHNLHELIDLSTLPPELILGIPEELFRKKLDHGFLFGQFVILTSGERIFCISAPAGKDISGRTVSISNLQILDKNEEANLIFSLPSNTTREDEKIINEVFVNKGSDFLKKFEPINLMLNAVAVVKRARSFSSETLVLSSNKPEWMPQKKKTHLSMLISNKYIFLLILFMVMTIVLYLRA